MSLPLVPRRCPIPSLARSADIHLLSLRQPNRTSKSCPMKGTQPPSLPILVRPQIVPFRGSNEICWQQPQSFPFLNSEGCFQSQFAGLQFRIYSCQDPLLQNKLYSEPEHAPLRLPALRLQ